MYIYRTIHLHIKEISHVLLILWLLQNKMEDLVEGSVTNENGTNASVKQFQTVLTIVSNNED
jgi:hypothetical protein